MFHNDFVKWADWSFPYCFRWNWTTERSRAFWWRMSTESCTPCLENALITELRSPKGPTLMESLDVRSMALASTRTPETLKISLGLTAYKCNKWGIVSRKYNHYMQYICLALGMTLMWARRARSGSAGRRQASTIWRGRGIWVNAIQTTKKRSWSSEEAPLLK